MDLALKMQLIVHHHTYLLMESKETIVVVVVMITLIGLLIMLSENETVNRVYGSFTADYNLNKWFNASLIIGADYTSDARKQNFEKGSRTRSTGYVSLTQYNSFLTDAILNISGGDAITDKINLSYLVSANAFDRTRTFLNSNGSNFHSKVLLILLMHQTLPVEKVS